MLDAVKNVFSNYVTFSGRASRSEFWFFALFVFLASIILSLLDLSVGTYWLMSEAGLFSGIFSLASILPYIAVSIRRLHDTGSSGWWFLLIFVPVIGQIALIIWFCISSNAGENRYGPEPRYFV